MVKFIFTIDSIRFFSVHSEIVRVATRPSQHRNASNKIDFNRDLHFVGRLHWKISVEPFHYHRTTVQGVRWSVERPTFIQVDSVRCTSRSSVGSSLLDSLWVCSKNIKNYSNSEFIENKCYKLTFSSFFYPKKHFIFNFKFKNIWICLVFKNIYNFRKSENTINIHWKKKMCTVPIFLTLISVIWPTFTLKLLLVFICNNRIPVNHALREFKTHLSWLGTSPASNSLPISVRYFYVPRTEYGKLSTDCINNVASGFFDPLHLEKNNISKNNPIFYEWKPSETNPASSPPSAACILIIASVISKQKQKRKRNQNCNKDNELSDSDTDNGLAVPEDKENTNFETESEFIEW